MELDQPISDNINIFSTTKSLETETTTKLRYSNVPPTAITTRQDILLTHGCVLSLQLTKECFLTQHESFKHLRVIRKIISSLETGEYHLRQVGLTIKESQQVAPYTD
ncbi:hypothetical protein M9H77_02616 [Catharanthus roseus]|uniref:Uncharacterized protein n=1 Tax=Catharanthus roseus TaxID=4058 RepID=A0ACC0C9B4_CATRO|nr:hypothetical protein M9H77_02616 [Catharanthus roseus]